MADELKTGGADAGAGASQTAGSVSGDAGQAGTPAITSVDQVPEAIRQQIYDTAFGKTMQTAETRFMEQFGDHINIANWISGREQMPEGVLEAMLQLPGLAGKAQLIEKMVDAAGGNVEDPRIGQLVQSVQAVQNQLTAQQQTGWVNQVEAKLKELAGDNPIKYDLLKGRALAAFKDGSTPTFTLDDLDKWSGETDTRLKESGHATKSSYVEGKMEAKTKGAEGSAGTPPSPGEPEDVGELGVFDDTFSKAVQAGLEAVEE